MTPMANRQQSAEYRSEGPLVMNRGNLALHNAENGHVRHMLVYARYMYHFLSAPSLFLPNKAVISK